MKGQCQVSAGDQSVEGDIPPRLATVLCAQGERHSTEPKTEGEWELDKPVPRKKTKTSRNTKGADVKGAQLPVCTPSTQPQPQVEERATTSVSLKEEPADAAQSEPPPKKTAESPAREICSVRSRQRYNPVSVDWQQQTLLEPMVTGWCRCSPETPHEVQNS